MYPNRVPANWTLETGSCPSGDLPNVPALAIRLGVGREHLPRSAVLSSASLCRALLLPIEGLPPKVRVFPCFCSLPSLAFHHHTPPLCLPVRLSACSLVCLSVRLSLRLPACRSALWRCCLLICCFACLFSRLASPCLCIALPASQPDIRPLLIALHDHRLSLQPPPRNRARLFLARTRKKKDQHITARHGTARHAAPVPARLDFGPALPSPYHTYHDSTQLDTTRHSRVQLTDLTQPCACFFGGPVCVRACGLDLTCLSLDRGRPRQPLT